MVCEIFQDSHDGFLRIFLLYFGEKSGHLFLMSAELLPPMHNEDEIAEKAIRRSDMIRQRFGTLSHFLKKVATSRIVQAESDCSSEIKCVADRETQPVCGKG